MSGHYTLKPGEGRGFSTRCTGLKTYLFTRSLGGDCEVTLHYQLSGCSDWTVSMQHEQPVKTDISAHPGAIIDVRNTGWNTTDVWTDY